jgi:opacity protein-like surface antigen
MRKLIATLAISTALVSPVAASDFATKANPFANAYTLTACGYYLGAGIGGTASSVAGTNIPPGQQTVGGNIFGTIGYGCPINATTGSFWFVEAQGGIQNLNGTVNGLSLSGPATFTQRFGAGTPLNQMLGNILPGTAPAVPSLPILPSGVTAGAGSPYAFVALHEDDVSAQVGLSQNQQWLISYGVGVGMRYRLSNAVVADTYAEYKAASNTICAGPLGANGCAHIGQGARVGVQFLY